MKYYTEEQKQFIKDNVLGISNKELTKIFNKRFNENRTESSIASMKKKLRLKNGLCGTFKKGQKPHNWKPVGYEFKSENDGYIFIKVAEPNTWVHKQQYLYEKYLGEVPPGYSVVFADQDKNNFDLDNLILVKNCDKLTAKNKKLFFNDKDLTQTGLMIAEIINKSSKLKKRGEN